MEKGLNLKYFVLNPTKDNKYGYASREALYSYAWAISKENETLANDIIKWLENIEEKINGTFNRRKNEK